MSNSYLGFYYIYFIWIVLLYSTPHVKNVKTKQQKKNDLPLFLPTWGRKREMRGRERRWRPGRRGGWRKRRRKRKRRRTTVQSDEDERVVSVTVGTDEAASSGPIRSLLSLQDVHPVLPLSGEDSCPDSMPCFRSRWRLPMVPFGC